MITITKITKNTLLTLAITPFFFSSVFAVEINSTPNENDSIYRYNALENNVSFTNLQDIDTDILKQELPINNKLDDFTKKLQDITLKQNFSTIQINNAIDAIKNRSGLKTFLIGNSLGILRFQSVQIKDQVSLLKNLILETEDKTIQLQIENQIKSSEQEQKKVENFILEQENKFSLFGWFVASL